METIPNVESLPVSLKDLVEKIRIDYYNPISVLCKDSGRLITEIRSSEISYDSRYMAISEMIIKETINYIDLRTTVFIPYINALAQKDVEGHNCSSCSGTCELQHSTKLIDFSTQLQQFKEKINDLIKASSKIYKRDENDSLKTLHNKITLLHNIVTELLYVEEDALLPRIKGAQKNIYAAAEGHDNDQC